MCGLFTTDRSVKALLTQNVLYVRVLLWFKFLMIGGYDTMIPSAISSKTNIIASQTKTATTKVVTGFRSTKYVSTACTFPFLN